MNEEDLKATKIQVQVLEEILSYKDKEIERLKEMKLHTEKYASEMEDKYILEKYKNNKAIEYIESIEDLKLKWISDSIVEHVGYKTIEDLDNKYHNLEGCFIEINKHYLLDILKGVDKE